MSKCVEMDVEQVQRSVNRTGSASGAERRRREADDWTAPGPGPQAGLESSAGRGLRDQGREVRCSHGVLLGPGVRCFELIFGCVMVVCKFLTL